MITSLSEAALALYTCNGVEHALDDLRRATKTSAALHDVPVLVPPHAVVTDGPDGAGVLVVIERGHPFGAELGGVDHDVAFLRVEPGLGILVSVAHDHDLAVDGTKLNCNMCQRFTSKS